MLPLLSSFLLHLPLSRRVRAPYYLPTLSDLGNSLRFEARQAMVPRGLEPRTLRLLAVRSKQLSYETAWRALGSVSIQTPSNFPASKIALATRRLARAKKLRTVPREVLGAARGRTNAHPTHAKPTSKEGARKKKTTAFGRFARPAGEHLSSSSTSHTKISQINWRRANRPRADLSRDRWIQSPEC